METDSDKLATPEKGTRPTQPEAYEPPSLRDLGSLRDLVASGGNTVMDGHSLRPGP